ncbi:MAG: T9SS type A sorting domain-containing protein, partial [Candidatus Eisenbacteria bacterium]
GFSNPAQFRTVQLQRARSEAGPFADVTAEIRRDAEFTVALDRDVVSGQTYYYRLAATATNGASMTFGPLSGTAGQTITEFALGRVAPNPTHDNARVDFSVPRASDVHLSVIDVQGREMATLASGHFTPGRYQAVWTGRTEHGQAPAGLYFIRLRAPGHNLTTRLVLSR